MSSSQIKLSTPPSPHAFGRGSIVLLWISPASSAGQALQHSVITDVDKLHHMPQGDRSYPSSLNTQPLAGQIDGDFAHIDANPIAIEFFSYS